MKSVKIIMRVNRMFKVGELISKYNISTSPKGYCVVVDKDEDNYTIYNNSLKCLQTVACVVVNELYDSVINNREESVFEMT